MKYMSYVETAESYDFWCAIWAIGTGVGYDVYVDRPNSPVHLNWYIILCAESGTTRKSTAISSISSILEDSVPLLAGKTSPENLEIYLHDASRSGGSAQAHFAVGELVTILGREGYMNTMPGLLTDLYDCQAVRTGPGTIAMGEIHQEKVYVTFLSASTPSWLVTAINPSVVEGGFTSRVMFIVDDQRKKSIAWPTARPEGNQEAVQHSYEDLVREARRVGGIGISAGGLRKFSSWYNKRVGHSDPFMSSFEAREDDHVLRCAACLAINDGVFEIQATHVTTAIKLIDEVKGRAASLFGHDFSNKSRLVSAVTRVREILIESGQDGIAHAKLLQRVRRHIDTKEMRMLMNIMHECGMIQIFKLKQGSMYRATKSIEKLGVTSEVLARLNLD